MYWHDGALSAESRQPFDLADRGLLLGDGVFDTSLVLGGRMVWRHAHLTRLAQACASLGFTLDETEADRAVEALVPGIERGALRLTVTRGSGPRGLNPPNPARPALFAALAPLAPPSFAPVSLQVSTIRRNETSPAARLKTLNYLDAVIAMRAAVAAGFDDAVFLNTRGHVACATVGNVVAVLDGGLVTPPVSDGILDGLTRAALLRLATALQLEPLQRSLTLDDLARADAVFVTNSLRLLSPVLRVGPVEKPRGSRWVDRLGDALCAAIREDCGVDPRAT